MNIRVLVASAFAFGILATAANALTVVNEDTAAYTLKVTPKAGKEVDVAIKAKATADFDCKDGCTVVLNGKSQAFDAKAVKFMIKGAAIVLK
jgi:hypothetical protein